MQLNHVQWLAVAAIVAGHILNAVGPAVYPYNIVAFAVGTIGFGYWAVKTRNPAQVTVNTISLLVCIVGLIKSQFN